VKAADFESAASTNSATRAGGFKGCNVTTFYSIVNRQFPNKFSKIICSKIFLAGKSTSQYQTALLETS
jgi:hypothetical protein